MGLHNCKTPIQVPYSYMSPKLRAAALGCKRLQYTCDHLFDCRKMQQHNVCCKAYVKDGGVKRV